MLVSAIFRDGPVAQYVFGGKEEDSLKYSYVSERFIVLGLIVEELQYLYGY